MRPMQATTATTSVALNRLHALNVHCEYGHGRSGLDFSQHQQSCFEDGSRMMKPSFEVQLRSGRECCIGWKCWNLSKAESPTHGIWRRWDVLRTSMWFTSPWAGHEFFEQRSQCDMRFLIMCRWWVSWGRSTLRCAKESSQRPLDISWHILTLNSKEVSTTFQCSRRAWTMNVFDRIDRMCRHYQWSDLVTWRYLCYGRFWSQKIDIFGWSQDSQDEFSLFCLPRSVPEAFCSPDFCTAGQNSWAFWLLAIFLAVSCRQDQKDLSPNGYLHVAFR